MEIIRISGIMMSESRKINLLKMAVSTKINLETYHGKGRFLVKILPYLQYVNHF